MQNYSFPDDMREYTITTNQIVIESFKLYLRSFVTKVIPLLFLLFGIVFTLRDSFMGYDFYSVLEVAGVSLFIYAIFLLIITYQQARKIKFLNSPMYYGFDEKALYITHELSEEVYAWELFHSYHETKLFFILNYGVQVLWPKDIWTEEELSTQKKLLKEKVSPKKK